jgi:hypothetical protein
MSIHLPKNPFSSFTNPFSSRSKAANGASGEPRPAQTAWSSRPADLPPRRNAAPAGVGSGADRADRRRPAPSPSSRPHAAYGAAPQAAPKLSMGAKLLSGIQIAEMDKMSDAQLGQVVKFLGMPAGATLASAPLAANWHRLRREFNEADMRKLIQGDSKQIVDFLLQPARPQQSPPRPERPRQSGPQASGPRPGPQGSNQARPMPSASAKPALKPISIIGMDRSSALRALADRGMKPQQLAQLKSDLFNHVNHGNSSSGAALNEKYKAFVSDDFTSSATYASYVKLLRNLPAN